MQGGNAHCLLGVLACWRLGCKIGRGGLGLETLGLRLAFALALIAALPTQAEQKVAIGDCEAHYVVFPSVFLSAEVAQRYGLPRAKDISILNLSVLDAAGQGTLIQPTGRTTNLLGQISPLTFREIREGRAIYYLAAIRHANREVLRFVLDMNLPEGEAHELRFQQELFWDE